MEDRLSNWSSNPTIVVAVIAVIGLIWQGGRWTGRIENGLKSLGERMDAQRRTLEERIDIGLESLGERMNAQRRTLKERIDTDLKALREEMRQEHSGTRRTLDTLLLRIGGGRPSAAGSSRSRGS